MSKIFAHIQDLASLECYKSHHVIVTRAAEHALEADSPVSCPYS